MRILLLASAAILAIGTASHAQTAAIETWVHAGRLLDQPGKAPRGPSTLIIRGGRIAEVRSGLIPPPAGVRLIDQSTRFVLPGLIDSHVHLESDAGGNASLVEAVRSSDAQTAFRALANARKTLLAGFTTVRNL